MNVFDLSGVLSFATALRGVLYTLDPDKVKETTKL